MSHPQKSRRKTEQAGRGRPCHPFSCRGLPECLEPSPCTSLFFLSPAALQFLPHPVVPGRSEDHPIPSPAVIPEYSFVCPRLAQRRWVSGPNGCGLRQKASSRAKYGPGEAKPQRCVFRRWINTRSCSVPAAPGGTSRRKAALQRAGGRKPGWLAAGAPTSAFFFCSSQDLWSPTVGLEKSRPRGTAWSRRGQGKGSRGCPRLYTPSSILHPRDPLPLCLAACLVELSITGAVPGPLQNAMNTKRYDCVFAAASVGAQESAGTAVGAGHGQRRLWGTALLRARRTSPGV